MAIGQGGIATAIGVTVTNQQILTAYAESPVLRTFNQDVAGSLGLNAGQIKAGSVRVPRLGSIATSDIYDKSALALSNNTSNQTPIVQNNTELVLRVKRIATKPRLVSDFEERINNVSGFLSAAEVRHQVEQLQQQVLRDVFCSIHNSGKDATGSVAFGGATVPAANKVAWTDTSSNNKFGYNDYLLAKQRLDEARVPQQERYVYIFPAMYRDIASDTIVLGFLQNQPINANFNNDGRIPPIVGFETFITTWNPLTNTSGSIPPSSPAFFLGSSDANFNKYNAIFYQRDAIVLAHGEPEIIISEPKPEYGGDAMYSTAVDYVFGVIRPESIIISYDAN